MKAIMCFLNLSISEITCFLNLIISEITCFLNLIISEITCFLNLIISERISSSSDEITGHFHDPHKCYKNSIKF